MNGFQGLIQYKIYAAIDYGRTEVSSAGDYGINRIGYGTNWIAKTCWTGTGMYGQIHVQHSCSYIVGADIELDYNSDITWYNGTNSRKVPNTQSQSMNYSTGRI